VIRSEERGVEVLDKVPVPLLDHGEHSLRRRRRVGSTPRQVSAKKILTREPGAKMTRFGPPTHKRCANCSGWLPLEAFSPNRRRHWAGRRGVAIVPVRRRRIGASGTATRRTLSVVSVTAMIIR
jgi:hypothetical protein